MLFDDLKDESELFEDVNFLELLCTIDSKLNCTKIELDCQNSLLKNKLWNVRLKLKCLKLWKAKSFTIFGIDQIENNACFETFKNSISDICKTAMMFDEMQKQLSVLGCNQRSLLSGNVKEVFSIFAEQETTSKRLMGNALREMCKMKRKDEEKIYQQALTLLTPFSKVFQKKKSKDEHLLQIIRASLLIENIEIDCNHARIILATTGNSSNKLCIKLNITELNYLILRSKFDVVDESTLSTIGTDISGNDLIMFILKYARSGFSEMHQHDCFVASSPLITTVLPNTLTNQ
ncbi:Hydrogenase maturation factor HypA [Trichinella pseudospiralis]